MVYTSLFHLLFSIYIKKKKKKKKKKNPTCSNIFLFCYFIFRIRRYWPNHCLWACFTSPIECQSLCSANHGPTDPPPICIPLHVILTTHASPNLSSCHWRLGSSDNATPASISWPKFFYPSILVIAIFPSTGLQFTDCQSITTIPPTTTATPPTTTTILFKPRQSGSGNHGHIK